MTEDMGVFFDLEGFAVTATWGALSTPVIFNAPADSDVFGGAAMGSQECTADLPISKFPGLARGDVITIAGSQYKVTEQPAPIEDGQIKRARLERAVTA